jgi:hypothetical protein
MYIHTMPPGKCIEWTYPMEHWVYLRILRAGEFCKVFIPHRLGGVLLPPAELRAIGDRHAARAGQVRAGRGIATRLNSQHMPISSVSPP